MKTAIATGLAFLLAASVPVIAKDVSGVTLPRGARIGVVNLLDPEITQFYGSNDIKDSFLKTHTVDWQLDAMLDDAIKPRLTQMGLELVPVAPSEGLARGRQEFFIDNSVSKGGLSKACSAQLSQMAAAERLDAFVLLVPAANDFQHWGSTRRKDLPEYLRGWGFVTNSKDPPGSKPAVFNISQVLLVSARGGAALLRDVEWGGEYNYNWPNFAPPADIHEVPAAEIDKLRPLFADILTRETGRLLDHIEVIGTP
jgi:hypothetical protein